MPSPPANQPFSMPMYKDWFPVRLRPWCYLAMILIFQLTAGLYLGNVSLIMSEGGLMREDVMFIGMCNIVAVNMPFPFLFKFKFRFSNNRLLLNATAIMLVCNFACMYVRSVPLLCILAFIEGFFKPCATFECFSNVQLWITKSRDMRTFFPVLFLFIAGAMSLQAWLAVNIAYTFENWRMMHWFIIGLLFLCLIFQFVCLRKFYIMKLPLKSIDWFGLLLWSLLFIGIVWIFTYGEYYNWSQSKTWCDVCIMTFIILLITIARMVNIRHPYISPNIFKIRRMYPILLTFFLAEWYATTPKVLGSTYIGAVMHWGIVTSSVLDLYSFAGVAVAALFSFVWMKVWRQSYMRLGTVGFTALLFYQVLMYFLISPATDLESLYLPMFFRGFGYHIILVVATIQLFEVFDLSTFFMSIAFTGLIRNGPTDCIVNGIYEFFLRRQEWASITAGSVVNHQDMVLIALKQVFGATCLIGCFALIVMLLADVQLIRLSMKKLPSWFSVGKLLCKQEKHDKNIRHKTNYSKALA